MKFLGALLIGIGTGTAAIFLHHFAPPFGLAVAITGTLATIWSIGRLYGKRHYKLLAAAAWLAIFWKGASLGVGNEILVQGDNLGNIFLFSSFVALLLAIALPVN
jgi:hypothetical protein